MAIKNYKAITPSLRNLKTVCKKGLHKGSPNKFLTVGKRPKAGRNNKGRITVRHKSSGHKKLYRIIDFKRNIFDINAEVKTIEYDPNRTAYISLIKYEDGRYNYIIVPNKMKVGDIISSSCKNITSLDPGNALTLFLIPIGSIIHNIELYPGAGSVIARAAGSYAQLVSKDNGYASLKLSSGEIRMVSLNCMATMGVVSNLDNKNISLGKAGRSRWLGIRPSVRGVAMNPIDHPHGGGEGKTSGGRHPVSPYGKPTKGKKTRNRKKASNKFIVKSRYKKKK